MATTTATKTQADEDIAVEASLRSTGLASAAVVKDSTVPVIDMSAPDVAEQLWKAATEVGFFTVVGHGIPQELIDEAFSCSQKFFAQSPDEKKKQSPLDMSLNCGYEYLSQVRPSTGVADQKESLQVTARAGSMEGRWPSSPENFRAVTEEFLKRSHELAGRLLDYLEPRALNSIEGSVENVMSKSHTLWKEDGQCTLRYLHYPPLPVQEAEKLRSDGYWRAGAHTDWDNVTLLYQRPGQEGLECCANPRTAEDPSKMYWTAVDPVPGGIAVNIGDMLARWSDGKLYSNLHRVRLPADASRSRYSIAFFAQSDKSTWIRCQNKEAITAGDYILSRIRSNFANLRGKKESS